MKLFRSRIAVTAAAFEALADQLPLGTVNFEREPDANGDRLIWLEPHVVNRLRAPRGQAKAIATSS